MAGISSPTTSTLDSSHSAGSQAATGRPAARRSISVTTLLNAACTSSRTVQNATSALRRRGR